jgi:hypothetical protein
LTKNDHQQGLPVQKASSAADFVIDELYDSKIFLSHIEEVFSNHKEHEDARWALLSLRQGTKSIAEFNIQFNTMLYTVKLSEDSKCEVYELAINSKIVKLGINRGGWTELKTLDKRQRMAVKLALDVGRVSQLNQKKIQPPQPCVEYCSTTVVAPQKLNEATPVDLNSVLADLGFSFANWRKECTNRALCY